METSKKVFTMIKDNEMCDVVPYGKTVLLAMPVNEEQKTKAGIILPNMTEASVAHTKFTVMAVGVNCYSTEVGDVIRFDPTRYYKQNLPQHDTPGVGSDWELVLKYEQFGALKYLVIDEQDIRYKFK